MLTAAAQPVFIEKTGETGPPAFIFEFCVLRWFTIPVNFAFAPGGRNLNTLKTQNT